MSDKDLFNKLKSEFLNWYDSTQSSVYYFTGKDAGNLKLLIKKIQFVGKEKHKDEGNEWVVDAFKWILGHLDNSTKKMPTIPIINSRFNEILANGRKTHPLRNLSPEYLQDVTQRINGGVQNEPSHDRTSNP